MKHFHYAKLNNFPYGNECKYFIECTKQHICLILLIVEYIVELIYLNLEIISHG